MKSVWEGGMGVKKKTEISSRLLRVDQVAQKLNCTRRQVYYLLESGEIRGLSIGSTLKKGIRVRESEVDEFIERRMKEYMERNGFDPKPI